MTKTRDTLKLEETWAVEGLYSSNEVWEKDYNRLVELAKGGWSSINEHRGKVCKGPEYLKKLLDSYFDCSRALEKLYTYAHLRHDEDIARAENKTIFEKSMALAHNFSSAISWVEPEILSLDQKSLETYLESNALERYRFFLEKLIDQKPYVLSDEKEELVSLALRSQQTPHSAFSALSNADMKFADVTDEKGEKRPLTQGSYLTLLRSRYRPMRKEAFETLHQKFHGFENTICELIHGQVQKHIFNQKARGFSSCVEAALQPNNVPVGVYTELIETVRKNLGSLHNYVRLRKDIMGVDELHFYDLLVPLVDEYDMKFSFDKSCDIIIDSVQVLGKRYQEILSSGLKKHRWVDVHETENKRSGAYSSGCYDSVPFILMNYHGNLQDLKTLTHEAGHSMQSFLSNEKQEYHYASYPIFVAEVASTFHEELTFRYLLDRATSKQERLYLLNQAIDDIRSTLFRQTMFAEFELKLHQLAEQDIPLTPELLKKEYRTLNEDYFGPDLYIDDELTVEFMRVPHFYYNFYVYQYATGISAAHALVEKVVNGKEKDLEAYLDFLSAGGSQYPIDLLKTAGVDMLTSAPVQSLLDHFQKLVEQFKEEMKK